ncbi:RNA-directed DNA polymerase, eukaryota, reverse transcriptase zinc-binding domain protein [Tanacetum coccineum]
MSIVLGDLNVVRSENERLGSLFCKSGARHFNEFISNSELVDLPMGVRLHESNMIQGLKEDVNILDIKVEANYLDENDISNRLSLLRKIEDLEHIKRLDLMQKAKVKWAIEGDENSKFFHGIVNNKLSRSRIKRISINVPKKDDPLDINDFRPISLIGCQYKVIAKVLANRIIQVVHSVISEVQMAYINGRQIIDGPLMIIEIISWAFKKKEHLFILKVNSEKAFDSLDWNFLHNIMSQMGF